MVNDKRSRLSNLLVQMLWVVVICCTSPAHAALGKRFLNVILFESYMTPSMKEGIVYDTFDWSTAEFPKVFSQLVGRPGSQNILIPSGFEFPSNPMFIDIYTFTLDKITIGREKKFSRRNDITRISYKLAFVLRPKDRFEVKLEGSHEDLKFRDIVVEVTDGKTKMLRIRHSANRTLYIALTLLPFIEAISDDIMIPKPISSPSPSYPSQLSPSKWVGRVRILCTILTTGRVDPQDYVLMECPHTLFARRSVDMVLNNWEFTPAEISGATTNYRMAIDVPFYISFPKLKLQLPIPK